MKTLIFAAALIAAPVAAQPTNPSATANAEAVDPARLALAKQAIDAVWPMGTYERMMSGVFDQMMDSMMASVLGMKVSDFAAPYVSEENKAKIEDRLGAASFRDAMKLADPDFEERMRITMRVMGEAMIPVMNRLEPRMREGLARAYARKFSAVQLEDMNRFFATPSGKYYAAESMITFMDPEVVALMGSMMPELLNEMPAMLKQVQAATAHLPPPPKRGADAVADDAEEPPEL